MAIPHANIVCLVFSCTVTHTSMGFNGEYDDHVMMILQMGITVHSAQCTVAGNFRDLAWSIF